MCTCTAVDLVAHAGRYASKGRRVLYAAHRPPKEESHADARYILQQAPPVEFSLACRATVGPLYVYRGFA